MESYVALLPGVGEDTIDASLALILRHDVEGENAADLTAR